MQEILIGIAIGVGSAAVAGAARAVARKVSLKTLTAQEVDGLKTRIAELEELREKESGNAELIKELAEKVDRINEAIPCLVKAVFALLVKAQSGNVNGEIDEALRDVKKYLFG